MTYYIDLIYAVYETPELLILSERKSVKHTYACLVFISGKRFRALVLSAIVQQTLGVKEIQHLHPNNPTSTIHLPWAAFYTLSRVKWRAYLIFPGIKGTVKVKEYTS